MKTFALLFVLLMQTPTCVVSRPELEARARTTAEKMNETQNQIRELAERIEKLQIEQAEMRGKATVWNTILGLLSSGAIVLNFVPKKKD